MDSDWVFNFDCNNKVTNIDSFFDANIIPLVFYQSVIERNRKELVNNIKYNPHLTKEVLKFFQYNLASSFKLIPVSSCATSIIDLFSL